MMRRLDSPLQHIKLSVVFTDKHDSNDPPIHEVLFEATASYISFILRQSKKVDPSRKMDIPCTVESTKLT